MISEYNIRAVLCDGVTKVVRQDGSEVAMPNLLPSAFFVIEPSHDKKNVVGYNIIGGGFGHGVGMSQNGAKNMALRGLARNRSLTFSMKDARYAQAIISIWRDFSSQMKKQNISAYASSTAFFLFLSVIPMLMVVCAVILIPR